MVLENLNSILAVVRDCDGFVEIVDRRHATNVARRGRRSSIQERFYFANMALVRRAAKVDPVEEERELTARELEAVRVAVRAIETWNRPASRRFESTQ